MPADALAVRPRAVAGTNEADFRGQAAASAPTVERLGRRDVVRAALDHLTARLPKGWRVKVDRPPSPDPHRPAAVVRITMRGGHRSLLVCDRPRRVSRSDIPGIASGLRARAVAEGPNAVPVVIAPFLSGALRARIEEEGLGYADATGNVAVVVPDPYFRLKGRGAKNARPEGSSGAKTLGGAKASRLVRFLCDLEPPHGIVALAGLAGCDAGYSSRLVSLLEAEGLVRKSAIGHVEEVDVDGVVRRWARDYDFTEANRLVPFRAPAGVPAFLDALRSFSPPYAITRGAAGDLDGAGEIEPPVFCYIGDPETAAGALGLGPRSVEAVDVGPDVVLVEPFDPVVFERTRERDGLRFVAASQAAADLLAPPPRFEAPVEPEPPAVEPEPLLAPEPPAAEESVRVRVRPVADAHVEVAAQPPALPASAPVADRAATRRRPARRPRAAKPSAMAPSLARPDPYVVERLVHRAWERLPHVARRVVGETGVGSKGWVPWLAAFEALRKLIEAADLLPAPVAAFPSRNGEPGPRGRVRSMRFAPDPGADAWPSYSDRLSRLLLGYDAETARDVSFVSLGENLPAEWADALRAVARAKANACIACGFVEAPAGEDGACPRCDGPLDRLAGAGRLASARLLLLAAGHRVDLMWTQRRILLGAVREAIEPKG